MAMIVEFVNSSIMMSLGTMSSVAMTLILLSSITETVKDVEDEFVTILYIHL